MYDDLEEDGRETKVILDGLELNTDDNSNNNRLKSCI